MRYDRYIDAAEALLEKSNSGCRYHEEFIGKLNDRGVVELVSVGKRDVYADIQGHALETDINVLIKRAAAGDLSAFTNALIYGDFTGLPDSPAELLNSVIEAERDFYKLPLDLREKFDNDFKKWFAQSQSDGWRKMMEEYASPKASEKVDEKEVKADAE